MLIHKETENVSWISDSFGGTSQEYFIFPKTNGMKIPHTETWVDHSLKEFSAHICSDGTIAGNICHSEENRIRIMNIIPIVCHLGRCRILCIQIMLTHIHLIVMGRPEDCEKVRMDIQKRIVRFLSETGQESLVRRRIDVGLFPIKTETELKQKIIYVIRNCIVAGYQKLPNEYPWGPGNSFFSDHDR
jgi:hypothetical protein